MKIRLALASTAAVLVAAVLVYFVARTQQAESPPMAAVEPQAADGELVDAELVSPAESPAIEKARRSPVAKEPPVDVAAALGTKVLRVVLEGITEEDARLSTVTLTDVNERGEWPPKIWIKTCDKKWARRMLCKKRC